MPGCTNSPGAALRAVIRPLIGLGTTSVGSATAIGDNAIDLGIGLAENPHRIARRAQIAFRGLLVGNRLVEIVLRYRKRLIELAKARQIAGGQLQNTRRRDQGRFGLQKVGAVDGE